jgi:hypothetical protein
MINIMNLQKFIKHNTILYNVDSINKYQEYVIHTINNHKRNLKTRNNRYNTRNIFYQ